MSERMMTPLVGQKKPIPLHCPDCKTENPSFGFAPGVLDQPGFGHAEYITIFCASEVPVPESAEAKRRCGAILSIALTAFEPDPALVAAARAAGLAGGRT